MITDRHDLLDLAIDVHDCAGSVRRGIGLPRFAGWNFRASEVQGAVARVQLTRLDGLLERMRANQARLAERVASLPGLTLRRANDDGGDAGICLVAFARTPELAATAVAALKAEGVEAMRIYDPAVPGPARLPVLAARARRNRRGRPPRARLPADARAARALDPRRRVAAQRRARSRRDRVRVREGRARDSRLTVRVGVVGGGLVAQAEHLPYLSSLRDRFTLAALAEPSRTVRDALGARYGIAGLHEDYRGPARRRGPRRGRDLLAGGHPCRGRGGRARRGPARLRREADVHHARRRRRDRGRARPGGQGRPGRDDEAIRPRGRGDARGAPDDGRGSPLRQRRRQRPRVRPVLRGRRDRARRRRATRADRRDAAGRGGAGGAGGRLGRRGRRAGVLARASSAACCTT